MDPHIDPWRYYYLHFIMNKLRLIAFTKSSEVIQRQGEEEAAPRPERYRFQIPTFQQLLLPWILSQPKRPFSPALHLCFCPMVLKQNTILSLEVLPLFHRPETHSLPHGSSSCLLLPHCLPSPQDHVYLKNSNETLLNPNLILDSPFHFYLPIL